VRKKRKKKKIVLKKVKIDLNDFAEPDITREPLNIVFIGHVDSGKSTTCGCILVETGAFDKNEIKKFK